MIKTYIIVAQTVDGKIARNSTHEADWTSRTDKKQFIELTKKSGVMVMGLNTFKTFPSPLKDRLHIVYSNHHDSEKDNIPGVVEYTKDSPSMLIQKLEERGFKEVAICGGTSVYTMFMKSGLVENIYLTIEPRLFGEGIGIFDQTLDVNMKLISVRVVNDENVLLLEYKINI
ncbi:dihydrofolate reductase [Arenimonas sp.]|nr:dihydrofolate reductase [Candidatus Parcubacteria bacterium]